MHVVWEVSQGFGQCRLQFLAFRILLAACRRERTSSHARHSGSACVGHGVRARAPEQSAVTGRTGSERATEWAGRRLPSPREDLDKVWKRLRLKAKQSRHHSPAAAAVPRKEN